MVKQAAGEADDDVAPDSHGGHQPRLLVDDGAHLGDEDLPAARHFEPGQNAEQGGLAAARGAEQGDELALGNGQVQIGQDLAIAEGLRDLDHHGRGLGRGQVHRTAW